MYSVSTAELKFNFRKFRINEMRSNCLLIRLLFIFVMLTAGLLIPIYSGANTIKNSMPHHDYMVGGDNNYPPYEYLDENGKPTGYNVELTKILAKQLGIKIKIILGPWNEVRKALEDDEIDLIHGMFYSEERTKYFDFSSPHTVVYHAIFGRKGVRSIVDIEELLGKKIIVMRGDIMHDFVVQKKFTDNLILTKSQEEALSELSAGHGDYALIAKLPGLYWINKNNWDNLKIVGPLLEPLRYCYAVKKGKNAKLLSDINHALAILNQSGDYSKIHDKWLASLEYTWGIPPHAMFWIYVGSGLILFLLLIVVLWTISLRRQVKKQTKQLRKEIDKRSLAQKDLEKWQHVFDNAQWGVAISNAAGDKLEAVNPFYAQIHGYTQDELLKIPLEMLRPTGHEELLKEHIKQSGMAGHKVYETDRRRKDGSIFPALVDVTVVKDVDGNPSYRVVNIQDITDRNLIKKKLEESEARLNKILNWLPVGVLLVDYDNHQIAYANPIALEMIGRPQMEVLGKECHKFVCPADKGKCPVIDLNQKIDHSERVLINRYGVEIPILKSVVKLQLKGAEYLLESFVDISKQKELEEELSLLATTDHLTGLYNRRCFLEKLSSELSRSDRYKSPTTLLMIDIDNFKSVNDRYGHPAGDEALRQLSEYLKKSKRSSDIIGRLGGEEFALILLQSDHAAAIRFAERLRIGIENLTISTAEMDFGITASIGIAEYAGSEEDLDQLMRRADQALYQAKHQGRNCCVIAASIDSKSSLFHTSAPN